MGMFRRRHEEPMRPPVADLGSQLQVGELALGLGAVEVGARVESGRLEVEVFHPTLAGLDDERRLAVVQEVLIATLGERGLRQVVHVARAATYPPIDAFGLEGLRAFARSLGADVDPPAEDAPTP